MPDLRINDRVTIPEAELDISFVRSGGPGGQYVNKTSTQAQIRWNALASAALSDSDRALLQERLASRLTTDGELIVCSHETRSQAANRESGLARLAALVAGALHRDRKRRPTRRTAGSKRRRLESKKRRSETKRLRRPPGS